MPVMGATRSQEAALSSAQPTFGFSAARLYRPQDEQMRQIASVGQLSQWRFHKRGLPFIQIGKNVYYSGHDLIRYLNEQRVEPRAPAAAPADAGAPA